MTLDNQTTFIRTIQQALGKTGLEQDGPDLFCLDKDRMTARMDRYANRSPEDRQAMVRELIRRAENVGMPVYCESGTAGARDRILAIAREKQPEWGTRKQVAAWDHPLLSELMLETALADHQIDFVSTSMDQNRSESHERNRLKQEIEAAYIGVTSADFVVAHTATMVMKTRPGELRSVSLVPCIHICVVRECHLVENLSELYTRLQWQPDHREEGLTHSMTFISAPSKTGDIELVMVNGAHGPREVHIILIRD